MNVGSAKPTEGCTILTIKLPFFLKNSYNNHKTLYLDPRRIREFIDITDKTLNRLTTFQKKESQIIYKPKRDKIDRIKLAKEYHNLLDKGVYSNQAELARALGVSRAWITKVLN